MQTKPIRDRSFILDFAPILFLRRNHGLEHATLNILAEKEPNRRMAGYSDLGGFWVVGEFATGEVQSAVQEALTRLRNGEYKLAVHPNCGTNFAISGILAGGVAAISMFGSGKRLKDNLERIPLAMTLATLAIIISQPLGLRIQEKITTCGSMDSLAVISVEKREQGGFTLHRVATRSQ